MRYFYDTEFIEDGKTIELISIGIVCEDGREYYAVSNEFDTEKVRSNEWLFVNVLTQLGTPLNEWKSREQIKQDIIEFVGDNKPEFWAYYADYDHVVLAQLFGTMLDLPNNFPMYTRDIKQLCDEMGNPDLPKQEGDEHHALDDARWNQKAYQWLIDKRQSEA